MAGVVFIISIPSEDNERSFAARKIQKKPIANGNVRIFQDGNRFAKSTSEKSTFKVNKTEYTGLLNNKSNLSEYLIKSEWKDIEENPTMKMVIEETLKEFQIENSVWSKTEDGNYIQIIFTMESSENYEKILNVLKEHNIGSKYNSVLSVAPCTIYYKESRDETEEIRDSSDDESKESMWTQFVLSVRARPTVAQVVENIKSQAALTFDFVCLLVIATTLCAIGLVENNNVYLLSSMLISPMMGPVMAATFGTVIRDKTLQKLGVQSEMLGLGIAVIVGFCYGAIICLSTDKYGENDWPTNEMIVRGEVRTLGVGCLIAVLSGAALALGLLSDNTASLVGVAISTSLMPPAVNAGLLWSLASIYYLKGDETSRYSTLAYTNYFSNDHGTEITCLGCMSLCLTFVNIVFIYIAGLIVFKIKEVAPIASRDHVKRHFWNHDVKMSRDYNRRGLNRSTDLSQSLTHLERKITTRHETTWSPCVDFAIKPSMKELEENYFNRLVKDKSLCSPSRKASFGYSTFENDVNIHIPSDNENVKRRSSKDHILNGAKKFLVTPSDQHIKL